MNENIEITDDIVLSEDWYTLKKITFRIKTSKGKIQTRVRDVFNRGNGAAILLYNRRERTVILTRQFRLPAYLNGCTSGMLIEVPAGMLDNEYPDDCIRRETEEETGYRIEHVQKVFEAYMSPGAMTELLHFYIAEYDATFKFGEGGGLDAEQEDIEVLEMDFEDAYEMIGRGEILDAKTIMLLQYARMNLFRTKQMEN